MIYPFFSQGFLGRPLRLIAAEDGGPLKGNDVVALQEACTLRQVDGIFGEQTDRALRSLQSNLDVTVDGICGPGTERAFCLYVISVSSGGLPQGLARGIIEGESGYRLGAQSPTYVRGGVVRADLGVVQFSTAEGDELGIDRALDGAVAISRLCNHLREKRAQYYNSPFVFRHRERTRIAGWLACGSWNAPAWTDVWASRGPDDPYLQRIITLQDGTPGTREQWIRNYVSSKIAYVTSWEV